MTKKDYIKLAALLNQYRYSEATSTIGSVVAMLSCDLADILKADNPAFDKEKWFTAVQKRG